MYLLLAQGMGFAGLVLNLLAYQCRNSRRLILTQLGSNITYVIHFLMLGAYTGCLSLSIMMLSNALLSLRRWRWAAWPGWRGVLCALFLAAAAVTWQGWLSVLPCEPPMRFRYVAGVAQRSALCGHHDGGHEQLDPERKDYAPGPADDCQPLLADLRRVCGLLVRGAG